MPFISSQLSLFPSECVSYSMFGKNLIYLRKIHNWTQSDLAMRLGIARTTLGDYERGKTEPNFQMLVAISELFDMEIDTLITSVVESGNPSGDSDRRSKRYLDPTADFMHAIDLVETKAEAGYLESFQDTEYIRDLPKIYLPQLPANEYRAFEIEGDSMLPLESGTIIVGVRVESLEDIRDQKTYIIITKREGMVYKRIRNDRSRQYLTAISDNPVFPPYRIEYESIAEIWQYYAHIGFSDTPVANDFRLAERIEDIQQKVTELHRISI